MAQPSHSACVFYCIKKKFPKYLLFTFSIFFSGDITIISHHIVMFSKSSFCFGHFRVFQRFSKNKIKNEGQSPRLSHFGLYYPFITAQ